MNLPLQLHWPVTFRLQVTLQVQTQVIALQLQVVDTHPRSGPVGCQLQVTEQVAAVQAQLADLDLAQLDGNRQTQGRQLQRAAVGRRITRRKGHVDALRMQLLDAQGGAQQAAGGPRQQRGLHLYPVAALDPAQPAGLPTARQAPLEIGDLQPRHPCQRPAATAFGPHQHTQHKACGHHHAEHAQQYEFEHTCHSSGPMEKCRRIPPSSSSALARSRRSGPTGETQRTPIPTPVLRLGSSSVLNELP
ncbi:hypothetical protein D3C81_1042490 [compost metagenome]